MIWRVCGKYDLDVGLELGDSKAVDRPFHHFPLADINKHAICREALVQQLPSARTVCELFGGLGVTASIFRGLHAPSRHVVFERSSELVAHLHRNGFVARLENAHTMIQVLDPHEVLDCDFGRFTILQWSRNPLLRAFTDAAFNGSHDRILFTDEAIVMFAFNRVKYGAVLGAPVETIDDYVSAWSRLWHGLYGYSIAAAERHRGAVYTLWHQAPPVLVAVRKTEADYPGVEVL